MATKLESMISKAYSNDGRVGRLTQREAQGLVDQAKKRGVTLREVSDMLLAQMPVDPQGGGKRIQEPGAKRVLKDFFDEQANRRVPLLSASVFDPTLKVRVQSNTITLDGVATAFPKGSDGHATLMVSYPVSGPFGAAGIDGPSLQLKAGETAEAAAERLADALRSAGFSAWTTQLGPHKVKVEVARQWGNNGPPKP